MNTNKQGTEYNLDIYSSVTLKIICAQEFVLVMFHLRSTLTKIGETL